MTRWGIAIAAALALLVIYAATFRTARGAMLFAAAILVALVCAQLLLSLFERQPRPPAPELDEIENGPAEMLRRWQARAEILAERADGSRADWDRHLRPMLAKEFELSTGLRITKNRKATEAAGLLRFGPELWRWVDPAAATPRDERGRAPGRAALDEILQRLQRM
ncbi:hypothetical protein [Nocardia arthritidis]|uniref:Uncharacterized protein n=1 Tax=Nocardia arthritidis TaxID=228602 RepID=A0A6G9Y5V1_9NOCA|nr:hypothetical protein [Nocardia arthritidis]QIS08433.1 hypothetical protein F5544_02565 [Nocardia arthritidis]